jgi:hypothetical protein
MEKVQLHICVALLPMKAQPVICAKEDGAPQSLLDVVAMKNRSLTLVIIKSPLFRSPNTCTVLANSRNASWNSTWVLDIAQH